MPISMKLTNGSSRQTLDRHQCQKPQQVHPFPYHTHQFNLMEIWELGALYITPFKNWGFPTSQHPTHTRYQYDWSERKTQHIWHSEEEILQYTQHQKQIVSRQLIFIGKVARNYEDHITTRILTAWYNHKKQRGCVLHTNKKSIIHNLRLIISGVDKIRSLNTWAQFSSKNNTFGI